MAARANTGGLAANGWSTRWEIHKLRRRIAKAARRMKCGKNLAEEEQIHKRLSAILEQREAAMKGDG